jgi:hypothetical protein
MRKKVAETRAWNWQQGCRLQWLGPDFNARIIFNDLRNGKLVSVVVNVVSGKEEGVMCSPIYDVHPQGRYAISMNFSRLDAVREGYGYKGIQEKEPGDGIYFVDLEKNESAPMISLAQLSRLMPLSSMSEGKHWADQPTFNPSGTKFVFLHRWQTKNGGMHSRLCAADFENPAPEVLLDSGMASHFAWKNDGEVLIWARPAGTPASVGKTGLARKILVPLYHKFFKSSPALRQKISGDSFLLFKLSGEKPTSVGKGIITEDGHCSFSPDGNWLMTDTYPEREHWRVLQLFHLPSRELTEVGRFYSLPDKKYGVRKDWDLSNLRTDLHPRWNRDGTQISFDSVHSGSRQVHVIDVGKIIHSR